MILVVVSIIILAVLCLILFAVAKEQIKRADQAEHQAASYRSAYTEIERRAVSLENILQKYKQVEVQNHEAQQSLAATADTDLVHRANALFGGVQNDSSAKRTGNR
jgi:Tfp pilus assembly protein PilO